MMGRQAMMIIMRGAMMVMSKMTIVMMMSTITIVMMMSKITSYLNCRLDGEDRHNC